MKVKKEVFNGEIVKKEKSCCDFVTSGRQTTSNPDRGFLFYFF